MLAGIATVVAAEERRVFAHYMTCFSSTPDFYGREIELAQRYAIDGFALNCGEWKKFDADGRATDTRYVTNADNMFERARKLGTGFVCFMSPDFAGSAISGDTRRNVTDMYRRYYDHPNLFRFRGKAFCSGYAGLPTSYREPATILRGEGKEILVVPQAGLAFLLPRDAPAGTAFRGARRCWRGSSVSPESLPLITVRTGVISGEWPDMRRCGAASSPTIPSLSKSSPGTIIRRIRI